jgi:hypothetical protein
MAIAAREISPPVKETKTPPAGIALPDLTMDHGRWRPLRGV